MANPFQSMSVIMQGLLALAIAVVLVLAGVYVPVSPVAQERDEFDKAVRQRAQLNQEVTQLQVYRQRYGELKSQMDALSKQLETLKTIVPEEKEVDEFIRLVQGAAVASNVQIRRLTAQPIMAREYHYDMPFEVQADGPYFNVLDFFGRLSRLSRIINVGDLDFEDASGTKAAKYALRPGTTVTGIFTATTFFTKAADAVSSISPTTGGAKPQQSGPPRP
jgi:type IV pilus assembly protein PilO